MSECPECGCELDEEECPECGFHGRYISPEEWAEIKGDRDYHEMKEEGSLRGRY